MLTLIRTHASSRVGLGHLRRCLSLANALRALGIEVMFGLNTSDVDAPALVAAEGFAARTFALPPDATGTDIGAPTAMAATDAAAFLASFAGVLTGGRRVDWVLVDHYSLDAQWHDHVRKALACHVAAIDDLADRSLAVDLLIDHNFVPPPGHRPRYAPQLQLQPRTWLCGPRFALLGPAYRHRPPFVVASQVRSIGIFLGGTDLASLSATALWACRNAAGFEGLIEVVSTSANPGLGALGQAVAQDPQAHLLIDLPDLADFFARHDLQIGAGGGATWERCCAGTPTLTLGLAANQAAVITGLQALGALVSTADNSAASIGLAVRALIDTPAKRQALSAASRALVDGRGAERVAWSMLVLGGQSLALRPVTPDDSRTLWAWRNDPATRAASRHSDDISWDNHCRWLANSLADPRRRLWLAHRQGCLAGVIRFDDLSDGRYEVSLYLDPGLHGLGLGTALLQAGEQALAWQLGGATVHAEVLPDNPASRRLFISSGYHPTSALTFSKTVAPAPACAGGPPELHR